MPDSIAAVPESLTVVEHPVLADRLSVMRDRNTAHGDFRQALFEAKWVREAADLKIETDHTLVWITPLVAVARLRHGSHAWGVAAWLRHRSG